MGNDGDTWRVELRDARKRLGLSQRVLAEQVGVSTEALRGYESGRRNAPRERLEVLIAALKIPNATANAIRVSAGFAPVNFLFTGERDRNYFYTADELPAAVEEMPWPEFVVNDAMEVVAANTSAAALWDIDFAHEKAVRSRAQMNLLSMASDNHFAERLLNWDECISMFVSIFKATQPEPDSLESPNAYFGEVVNEFINGDPAFLARLLKAWAETEARDSKVRWWYPIVWEDREFGVMRLRGIASTASDPDALAFNDWIPVDAASWAVLEQVKSRKR